MTLSSCQPNDAKLGNFFKRLAGTPSPLHRLLERPQAIRDDPAPTGRYAGFCVDHRNRSNYPLPDAVVAVIDRLVDLKASPRAALRHGSAATLDLT
jgi:hypothetical protein